MDKETVVDAHDEAQLDNKEQATCNHNMDSGQQAEMGRQKKNLFFKNSIYVKFYQMYSNLGWAESHSAAPRGCEWRQLDYKGRTSQPLRVVVVEMLVISAVGMVSWVCAHIKTRHAVSVRAQFPVLEPLPVPVLLRTGGTWRARLPPPHPPCSLQK